MKKTIIIGISIIMLLMTQVNADLWIDQDFHSDGDIHYNSNIYASGNVHTSNNVTFINPYIRVHDGMNPLYRGVSRAARTMNKVPESSEDYYTTQWYDHSEEFVFIEALKKLVFRFTMDLFIQQNKEIQNLKFEVQALKNMMNANKLCETRVALMVEQQLDNITCADGIVYYPNR